MRQQIVEAARKRFAHYGYSKTTMAELASDCNMSSGNLYRYFPGKLDIAEEIGRDSSQRVMEETQAVVRQAGPCATDKLRVCLKKLLEVTYGQVKYDARVYEMVVILRRERPEFWTWQSQCERKLIAEILRAGNASGEFAVPDPDWMAEIIRAASFKYHYPQLYIDAPLEELNRELESLIDLILKGIAGPKADASEGPPALEQPAMLPARSSQGPGFL